jgi:hypothetical protein
MHGNGECKMSWLQIDLMVEAAVLEAVKAHREYTIVFFGAEDLAYVDGIGWINF